MRAVRRRFLAHRRVAESARLDVRGESAMRKCESCQYEHNHAHNTHCQVCHVDLLVPIAKAMETDEGGEA